MCDDVLAAPPFPPFQVIEFWLHWANDQREAIRSTVDWAVDGVEREVEVTLDASGTRGWLMMPGTCCSSQASISPRLCAFQGLALKHRARCVECHQRKAMRDGKSRT